MIAHDVVILVMVVISALLIGMILRQQRINQKILNSVRLHVPDEDQQDQAEQGDQEDFESDSSDLCPPNGSCDCDKEDIGLLPLHLTNWKALYEKDPAISEGVRLVLDALAMYYVDPLEVTAFATQQELATDVGLSASTVSRRLLVAQTFGYLQIDSKPGTVTRYVRTIPTPSF
jgi:hypothetical protein